MRARENRDLDKPPEPGNTREQHVHLEHVESQGDRSRANVHC